MKIKTLNILFMLCASILLMNAQIDQSTTVKVGGLYQKDTEKIILDEAQLSVLYQFKHGFVDNKEISFVIDTMVLVAGSEYSIYFDRNDKNRREAFSSYFTDQGPPKVFISTPYGEFTEIAVNDNYLILPQYLEKHFNYIKIEKRALTLLWILMIQILTQKVYSSLAKKRILQ